MSTTDEEWSLMKNVKERKRILTLSRKALRKSMNDYEFQIEAVERAEKELKELRNKVYGIKEPKK